MKQEFKSIEFDNKHPNGFKFDLVNLEDLLKMTPTDHSQFEFHKVSFYVVLLCTSGSGVYNLNFKDYSFQEGTLFTLRKDNVHKFYKHDAKGVLLIFSEDFIVSHVNKLDASKIFLLFNEMLASPRLQLSTLENTKIVSLLSLIKDEYQNVNDEFSPSIVRNLVQIFTANLFRIKSKDNFVFDSSKYLSMFLKFQELVERDCFENKKVSYYADQLGVTTKTLNNVTQGIIRKSAKSLIIEVVIIQAKRLIINSQDSLSEIAYQVGFDDPTNFFKYFTKHAGVSPSQFREAYQYLRMPLAFRFLP